MNGLLFFSHSVVSDSATQWTAARQASLSFTISRVCSNSCPLRQRYPPTILSSVIPFSSLLQSLPASGSFPVSKLFASGGQSIGASASASVLPMSIQGWFPLRLTGSNPGLLYCWQILYCLSHQGNQELPINSIKLHTLPSMQEMQKTQVTRVQSLGWEDPMEKEMATHSSVLAWRIPWTEEPGRSTGSQRIRHDWATFTFYMWWPR